MKKVYAILIDGAICRSLCIRSLTSTSGKTIVAFVTHGGSSFSNTVSAIKSLESNAEVIQGLSIRDSSVSSSEMEIKEWIKNNNGGKANE